MFNGRVSRTPCLQQFEPWTQLKVTSAFSSISSPGIPIVYAISWLPSRNQSTSLTSRRRDTFRSFSSRGQPFSNQSYCRFSGSGLHSKATWSNKGDWSAYSWPTVMWSQRWLFKPSQKWCAGLTGIESWQGWGFHTTMTTATRGHSTRQRSRQTDSPTLSEVSFSMLWPSVSLFTNCVCVSAYMYAYCTRCWYLTCSAAYFLNDSLNGSCSGAFRVKRTTHILQMGWSVFEAQQARNKSVILRQHKQSLKRHQMQSFTFFWSVMRTRGTIRRTQTGTRDAVATSTCSIQTLRLLYFWVSASSETQIFIHGNTVQLDVCVNNCGKNSLKFYNKTNRMETNLTEIVADGFNMSSLNKSSVSTPRWTLYILMTSKPPELKETEQKRNFECNVFVACDDTEGEWCEHFTRLC